MAIQKGDLIMIAIPPINRTQIFSYSLLLETTAALDAKLEFILNSPDIRLVSHSVSVVVETISAIDEVNYLLIVNFRQKNKTKAQFIADLIL